MKEKHSKLVETEPKANEFFNNLKFELTKRKFLRKAKNTPDLSSGIGISYDDVLGGVLYFLSLYNVSLNLRQIEYRMESIIAKNNRKNDPRYDFADGIFTRAGGVDPASPYESCWNRFYVFLEDGSRGEGSRIAMSNDDNQLTSSFAQTRWWQEKLGPKIE